MPPHPEGYLVHNLEHGYVIFWYNCQADPTMDCSTLKQQIKSVMNEYGGAKLIAFPWKTLDAPVAMTSWGRLLKLQSVVLDIMRQFVRSNRYQAPETTGELKPAEIIPSDGSEKMRWMTDNMLRMR